MSAFITGKFNLNEFDYDPLRLAIMMDNFVKENVRFGFEKNHVAASLEDAQGLFKDTIETIELASGRVGYNMTISIGEEPYAKIISENRNYIALCNEGMVGFWLDGDNINLFSTDTKFMNIDKELLRGKTKTSRVIARSHFFISDLDNFLLVNELDDGWHSRTRKILETTDEWLMRSHSSPRALLKIMEETVDQAVKSTPYEDAVKISTKKKLCDFYSLLTSQDKDTELWMDSLRVPVKVLLNHVKKFIPDADNLILTHYHDKLNLMRKQQELNDIYEATNSNFKTIVNELVTGGLPQIQSTANKESHPCEDPASSLWKYCTFLGSIGFYVDGKLVNYDCGLWLSKDGKEISATFVSSSDHTKYHSIPFAKEGKVLESFTEICKVNRTSVITAIHEWIQKEATAAKYIRS